MEIRGVLFDVGLKWDEVVIDKRGGLFVVVRFGLQPSACTSSRSGAEIDEYWLVLVFCLSKCAVSIFDPFDFHLVTLRLGSGYLSFETDSTSIQRRLQRYHESDNLEKSFVQKTN